MDCPVLWGVLTIISTHLWKTKIQNTCYMLMYVDSGLEKKLKAHSLVGRGSSETQELLLAQTRNQWTPVTWSCHRLCHLALGIKVLKQIKWIPGGTLNRHCKKQTNGRFWGNRSSLIHTKWMALNLHSSYSMWQLSVFSSSSYLFKECRAIIKNIKTYYPSKQAHNHLKASRSIFDVVLIRKNTKRLNKLLIPSKMVRIYFLNILSWETREWRERKDYAFPQ